jgi:hypothetical protein
LFTVIKGSILIPGFRDLHVYKYVETSILVLLVAVDLDTTLRKVINRGNLTLRLLAWVIEIKH